MVAITDADQARVLTCPTHTQRIVADNALLLQVKYNYGPMRIADVDRDDDEIHLQQRGGCLQEKKCGGTVMGSVEGSVHTQGP